MTAFNGPFSGIGHNPCETKIRRRTSSRLAFQASMVFGGVNGKYPFKSFNVCSRTSSAPKGTVANPTESTAAQRKRLFFIIMGG
jgi:hypothetical protein